MGFLNKKEEVLDIELTQYGKHLLSQGKFVPVYYSFFDDDIIYDWKYAEGADEPQNYAETRILEETPSNKAQYVFSGRETRVNEINDMVRQNEVTLRDRKIQQTPEKHYALSGPLGNSTLTNSFAPAWGVKAHLGKFNKLVKYQQGAHPTLKIPQLDMGEIEFKTKVMQEAPPDEESTSQTPALSGGDYGVPGSTGELGLATSQYPDGSYIVLLEDPVLLEFEETNAPCLRENFEIEVFLVEEETDSNIKTPGLDVAEQNKTERLIPLSFVKEYSNIKNNILMDDKDVEWMDRSAELDGSFVENYFKILVDKEIDIDILCEAGVRPDTTRCGTFTSEWLKCPDRKRRGDPTVTGLYDSDAEAPFGEDC
tara:strand:- start:117 stop:1220 length:1104 start_codon:yes stop_codon:yes gene_type:complete